LFTLYFRLIAANIRSQMQHKASFWLDLIGFGLLAIIEFATTAILLQRFGMIGGWGIAEIAILYGLSSIAFSFAEMAARGFDRPFEIMMQAGAFDSILIRPLGSFFQVLASEFQLRRLGRTFQGAAILAYGIANSEIAWNIERVLILPITMLSGGVIFTALVVIGATISFWTIKTPEVINIFTSGGYQMASYPLHIFSEWMRNVFLFIVPVAFASYPAGMLLLGKTDPHGIPAAIAWAAPFVAALFFGASLAFWRIGVQKYTSTGT
jgi:ABC-2 type transport system permease protein